MSVTHKAAMSFIGRTQKTAKTECGKIVKTSAIAIESDCTCIGCRAEVDTQWAAIADVRAALIAQGLEPRTSQAECEPPANKYHSIIFL
jgi:hypothetical protein